MSPRGPLRVGVVGAGAMGAAHVRTLATDVAAARVSRVFDADLDRAASVAAPVGAEVAESAEALIGASDVDAVIVCSPDFTHADLVHGCLRTGTPVLCEKPLAVTPEDTLGVVEAEVAGGRHLVQVGFMRRYDPGFVALRGALDDGGIGDARVVHCVHRNASSHTSATDAGIVTGSMVHELDLVRWLLRDEVAAIEVRSPVAEGLKDPQLATIEMARGTLVSVEVFVNAGYGYDVRCEVVGTRGTAALAPQTPITRAVAGVRGTVVADDFVAHFADAYRIELGAWVTGVLDGRVDGPTAWDGHLATVVAGAGVASVTGAGRVEVDRPPRPSFYA